MLNRLAPAALACACLLAFAPALDAQPREQRTTLTFDSAVEIPGQTLDAGTYEFRLADSRADRHIVQIWNEAGTELVATLMAVPERRPEAADDMPVSFAGSEPGTTPALTSWFYPGEATGHRFVYPEDQARRIAERTREVMLTADADSLRPERIDEASLETVDARGERARYDGAGAAGITREPTWQEDTMTARVPPAERGLELEDENEDRVRDQARRDPAPATDRAAAADQQADVVTQPRRGTFVGTERDDETEREETFGDDQRTPGRAGPQLGVDDGTDVTEQYELTRAQEHLRSITELTDSLLYVDAAPAGREDRVAEERPHGDRGVVGTTGAVGTAGRTGDGAERVSISRADLEALRAHALQAKQALEALADDRDVADRAARQR
jgi:hypothetical protein